MGKYALFNYILSPSSLKGKWIKIERIVTKYEWNDKIANKVTWFESAFIYLL